LITYSEEDIEDIHKQASELLDPHKVEFGAFKELKVDIDVDGLMFLQNDGRVISCVARDGDKLVGYCVDILSNNFLYNGNIFSHTLVYYILPEYRARCGRGLLKFVERVEKEIGVYARITGFSKSSASSSRAGDFLRALGYSDLDATLLKRL
jgi:hypothetical protein